MLPEKSIVQFCFMFTVKFQEISEAVVYALLLKRNTAGYFVVKRYGRTRACLIQFLYQQYSLYLARKYARMFVRGHYLFRDANSFPKLSSRKTVSFEEQIMSNDKYPSIFSPRWRLLSLLSFKYFYWKTAFNFGDLFWK